METPPKVTQLLVVDDARRLVGALHLHDLSGPGWSEHGPRARRPCPPDPHVTFDVSGVLRADGCVHVDDHGREFKSFSALDGVGMKLAMQAGIEVAWITGSNAPNVAHRARQLGIRHLVQAPITR